MDMYCILPGGNQAEFLDLDIELSKRKVAAKYCETRVGTRIYWIPADELSKLAHDERGPYLGDDDSGHSIYPLPLVDTLRADWGCGEWKEIT